MAKKVKTNALRILDKLGTNYEALLHDTKDGNNDGVSVAIKCGKDPSLVFKTLVARGNSKSIYVFIIPVSKELDLKKAAQAAGEKKIEMIAQKELLPLTGYVKGGCSPIGMKKNYPTFIDSSAAELDMIIVSGGKLELKIYLPVESLIEATKATVSDLAK
ncbi:Cys-tRNA(Pro) deacylase [Prolixibacteraceae bacterium JC049]|nr:Cys-tRNA(Pro) deacylase [Prolixibacteraceae bacterium JC049]